MIYERPDELPAVGKTARIRTDVGVYTVTGEAEGSWMIEGTTGGLPLASRLVWTGNAYHYSSSAPLASSGPRDGDWVYVLTLTL